MGNLESLLVRTPQTERAPFYSTQPTHITPTLNDRFHRYRRCGTESYISRKNEKDKKKRASSVGIEPTTSRLTVERANQLRHEDGVF